LGHFETEHAGPVNGQRSSGKAIAAKAAITNEQAGRFRRNAIRMVQSEQRLDADLWPGVRLEDPDELVVTRPPIA
jgi:hypothetical protein